MEMPAAMKVARGCWEQEPTSLSLGCKRLRPLAPKLTAAAATKSFIRPESGPRKPGSSDSQKKLECTQVESGQGGGTRWNPTQEQIGILEMLYKGGMRTPNAQQIEHITAQLDKYGKIEGKNVFYWFQNHKARERQKLKRTSLGLTHTPRTPPNSTLHHYCVSQKRKCRSWPFDQCHEEDNSSYSCTNEDEEDEDEDEEEEEEDRTLKLFPLHPEGR